MAVDSFETVLKAIREPAAILDPEGRVSAVNAQWSQITTDQALAGERFSAEGDYLLRCKEVRGGDLAEEVTRGVRGVLEGQSTSFTLEYACDNASPPRHFELVASALPTGAGTGALITHYDITERKRLEAAHRQAEERIMYVLEMLPEGYWDWNLKTGYVYYSERWCESLGFTQSELAPTVESWSNLVHPDDLARVMATVDDYLEGRIANYRCENRLRMKNGKYRWNLDRGRVVARDADGKPVRFVGLDIDISDRKEAELLIEEQSKRLMDLSTPLIPISDNVVVMPLIGAVDAQRAQLVLSTLLDGLSRTRASVAILDITGVSLIDSHVAGVLVNAAKAVQLLGAQVVLTGVRPEVATILVGLDMAWGNIVMRGTLQSGIAYATGAERARHAP